jgi:hypothetical protein
MDKDKRQVGRQVLQSVADRVDPVPPTDGNQEPVQVTLKDPWGRIGRAVTREHANNHSDIASFVEELDAMEQHWLTGDPAKLFQFSTFPAARARSGGNDHHTNVSHLRRTMVRSFE